MAVVLGSFLFGNAVLAAVVPQVVPMPIAPITIASSTMPIAKTGDSLYIYQNLSDSDICYVVIPSAGTAPAISCVKLNPPPTVRISG